MKDSSPLLKVVVLAGGAVLGVLVSRWVDDFLAKQGRSEPDYDKERYAQGLGPISSQTYTEEDHQ